MHINFTHKKSLPWINMSICLLSLTKKCSVLYVYICSLCPCRLGMELADCCQSVCLPLLLYSMLMHMNRALCLPLCPLPVPHMPLPCAPLIQRVGAWLSLTCHQITHTKFTCIPQLSSCCRFVTKNKSWSSWLSRSGMSAASLIGRDRERAGSTEKERPKGKAKQDRHAKQQGRFRPALYWLWLVL